MRPSIQNQNLIATFNTKGAELISLKAEKKEYIWNGNPEFWGKHSPVLFPIVGTLKNNSFTHNDKLYHLSRHGFARDLEFEVIEQNVNSIVFSLVSNSETFKHYPFDFGFQIKYFLDKKTLKIEYFVFNKSQEKMPFSIGAHPAFDLPNDFENYSLEFSENETLNCYLLENDLISEVSKKLVLKDQKLPLSYSIFKNDALVFKTLKSKSITISENSKPFINVKFDAFPNLGIWTKPNAKFICIEPWFGYSDTINCDGNLYKKEGILILSTNEVFETKFFIKIL